MTTRRASDRNPRATRACARCRKRKIKCDLAYPQCGMCAAVGTDCIGFNSATGEEQPRSLVSFLEEKVARLEVKLASLQNVAEEEPGPGLPEIREGLVRALTLRNGSDDAGARPWDAAPYLSSPPLPTLQSGSILCGMRADGWLRGQEGSHQKRDIASIPRNVVDIMLKHYSETYLVQYPILGESELTERCDRVCNRAGTAFDNYVVCMALSISAHTLIHHDHIRATKAADEFWESAIMHLDAIWQQSPLTQLQAIMLMCHYGFVNPSAANSIACSQAAMALCVHLGLHREPTPENIRRQIDVEDQRRIFWTCYMINAQNQMLLAKAFDIDQIRPSVRYPAVRATSPAQDARLATANYLYAFRQLESEITMGLFHPQSCSDQLTAPGWLQDIHSRIKLWRERLESQDFATKVEFREVMFQFQRLRLNRPSPRSPVPCFRMRRESIAAGTFLVAHYCRVMRQGGFFYWHHSCWHLFEIGVVLADGANAGLDLIWRRQQESFLQPNEAVEIAATMRSIPVVLRSMKHRWPRIEGVAVELDRIFGPVLDRLGRCIAGEILPPLPEAQTEATKVYLLGENWKQLEDADSRNSTQPSRMPPAASETMTMEEVFRVLHPGDSRLPVVPHPLDVSLTIPELSSFDSFPDPDGFSPTEGSLFWHGGGFELDDLFTAFDAGGFY